MEQFLVLLCHNMDDIPVGIFPTRQVAEEMARKLPWDYVPDCWDADASSPVCIKIMKFTHGLPVELHVVRFYTE